jgi:hypothetical protein
MTPIDQAPNAAPANAVAEASSLTFTCLACGGSVEGIRAQLGSLTCDDCPRH